MRHLTGWVGLDGRVFATELDPIDVATITELAQNQQLGNVSALLGTATQTGLPPACCDAIVMRMVYHHFTDPEPFISSLHASLKPGGRLLVIDFQPSMWMSTSTPSDLPEDREGQHGIAPATVISEVTSKGFSLLDEVNDWPGPGGMLLTHFGLVFIRG